MHRAIPVGNKVCAARVRKRYEDQRRQRIQEMKPSIDNTPPGTIGMPHLRQNRKRDEMLNQRHDEIERDNMLMLQKMHEMGRKTEFLKVQKSSSVPSLRCPGGPAQQREYDRIMLANAQLLSRIRNTQGEINIKRYEEQYARTADYVKLACEYPPPLLKPRKARSSPSGASLTRLDDEPRPGSACSSNAAGSRAGHSGGFAGQAAPFVPEYDDGADDADLRYVLQEARPVGPAAEQYFVEMATDGHVLAVSIYDEATDRGYELVLDEERHAAMRQEIGDDYRLLADRLLIENEALVVGPPPPGRGQDGTSAPVPSDEAAEVSAAGMPMAEEPLAEEPLAEAPPQGVFV